MQQAVGMALTAAASPNNFPQSSTGRLEVSSVLARSYRRMMISSNSSAAVRGQLTHPEIIDDEERYRFQELHAFFACAVEGFL